MKASSISVKILATALVLASSTGVALAKNYKGESSFKDMPACPPPVMLKDGFYLGAQVGYDSYRVREGFSSPVLNYNPVINNTGWVGGLFLGYGQYLSDLFYLGGEIFGNLNGSSVSNNMRDNDGDVWTNKFTTNGSYGLALLPGLRLNDTSLGYLRLGWNWANLKGANTVTDAGVQIFNGSNSKTANGFNFGLGIETLLMTNWSVRTEFNHTWYNSFNAGNTSYNASDNQFMLGLLYHFS